MKMVKMVKSGTHFELSPTIVLPYHTIPGQAGREDTLVFNLFFSVSDLRIES